MSTRSRGTGASIIILIIALAYLAFVVYALYRFFDANGDHDTHAMTFWGFVSVFLGVGAGSARSRS